MKFKNIDNMLFETGNATTDSSGTVTVTLNCFKPDETPCVTAVSYDIDGNSNVNGANLSLVGGLWQVDIVTSAPNIKVFYHAFRSTGYIPLTSLTNIITQDLFDLITQDNENLLTQ
jgi:hypothetical protein